MKNIEYDVSKISGLSREDLAKLLSEWQKKLKMSDWDLSLSIVNFRRKDYKQSGDFEADVAEKKAKILLTSEPFRGDEEYTLVHELIHVLLYEYDKFSEDTILDKFGAGSSQHDQYMEKLESAVHQLTEIILGRSCSR